MCGIIGYYGEKDVKSVLLKGLKDLEYRGYDSSGVAILHEKGFKRIRARGALSNLESLLREESFKGSLGIGHTRWATHGPPTRTNAHPHKARDVYVVHNGIIENFVELKTGLLNKGLILESETDSEIFAHLIAEGRKEKLSFLESVFQTMKLVKGAYSVVCVCESAPGEIIGFKKGPPLVVGIKGKDVIVCSDAYPLSSHYEKVFYLEDDEVVRFKTGSPLQFFDSKGNSIEKKDTPLEFKKEDVKKRGFKHHMLKEIYEQPSAVSKALDQYIDLKTQSITLGNMGLSERGFFSPKGEKAADKFLKNVERVFIVGCGSSYYAGLLGKYVIENVAKIPVEVDIASEFRYRDPAFEKNSLVFAISQSGETADTLAALKLAKDKKMKVLSLCNTRGSSVDRDSDGRLYMKAGLEVGVASTKAFVCSLVTIYLFSFYLAKKRGLLGKKQEKKVITSLLSLPSYMESVLAYNKFFSETASLLKNYKGFLYMGRGVNYPIALEGALKLKELAYMHAEGYAAGEMKHGPLALVDERMCLVFLNPKGSLYEKTLNNLRECQARGGKIIAIGTEQDKTLKDLSEGYICLPKMDELMYPFVEIIPLQLMAYHVALALGNNVDQPRNLAKSVTVE